MRKHIPNFITLLNLTAGALSIISIIEGYILYACYFIMVASILDFLDGFFAKLLKVQSELGKQLDSFSDLVSYVNLNQRSISFPTVYNMSMFGEFNHFCHLSHYVIVTSTDLPICKTPPYLVSQKGKEHLWKISSSQN